MFCLGKNILFYNLLYLFDIICIKYICILYFKPTQFYTAKFTSMINLRVCFNV